MGNGQFEETLRQMEMAFGREGIWKRCIRYINDF